MVVKVLFFGVLSDIAKTMSINVENKKDTNELIKYIETEYPQIKKYKYKVSVNRNLIANNIVLNNKDEIALLPPFAGG